MRSSFPPPRMLSRKSNTHNLQHQLATKNAPADFAPDFHAKTYPPGTAPEDSSYTARMEDKTGGQANNPDVERSHGKESTKTTAESTLRGATSKDVHRGLGHPGVGQTNNEIRHNGEHGRKHQANGLEGVGTYRQDRVERNLADQRGIDREGVHGGEHGDKGILAAENIAPEPAEKAHYKYQPRPQATGNSRR